MATGTQRLRSSGARSYKGSSGTGRLESEGARHSERPLFETGVSQMRHVADCVHPGGNPLFGQPIREWLKLIIQADMFVVRFTQILGATMARSVRRPGALAFLISSSLSISACAVSTIYFHDQPEDYEGPIGFVVGSVIDQRSGEDKTFTGNTKFLMRSLDEKWMFQVSMTNAGPPNTEMDFEGDGYKGLVFRIPVAAGQYEIIRSGAYIGFTTYWPNEDFSVPFTVEAGKSTYLGSFTPRSRIGGARVGPYFSVTDERDRDFSELSAKYPEFDPESAIVQIPEESVLFYIIRQDDLDKIKASGVLDE